MSENVVDPFQVVLVAGHHRDGTEFEALRQVGMLAVNVSEMRKSVMHPMLAHRANGNWRTGIR